MASGRSSAKPRPPRQRLRYGPLPKPADVVEVPYGQQRPELKGLSCGELTMIVAETQAFKDEIGDVCAKLDKARQGRRGPAPAYTALECELVLLYQRVCGLRSYREARDRLAGDRAHDARRLFRLDQPRPLPGKRVRTLTDGIPSEATVSRHRKRFGERRRRGAYERLAQRLIREHLIEFPEMREEARIVGIDGSKIATHYTCPRYDKHGKLLNADRVTCHDGGYVPDSAGAEKSGQGYNLISMSTMTGLPLSWGVTRLSDAESQAAEATIDHFQRDVRPHLDHSQLNVLLGDAAFHSHAFRRASHQAGFVEVIHRVSHSDRERTRRNAERHTKMRFEIDGYPNWQANGHSEIFCKCGRGQTSKVLGLNRGRAVVRTEGRCSTCGTISVTAGRWRKAKNPNRFVRVLPGEQDRIDWAFGNPLTYHDQLASIYGRQRFAHGEGFHGHLVSRFQLLKGKRWFRRIDQPRTDTAIVFSVIHALAIEQRRRVAAARSESAGSDPPTAEAA